MGPPFGGHPLTFRRLLAALRARSDCVVSLQADAGIRDARGSESGTLYYVERRPEGENTRDLEVLFHFVEVHHPNHVVAPSRFHTICERLGIDEGELNRQALEIE